MTAPFRDGSYRRRIRLVSPEPGVVEGGLEDDFHHFEVTLHHDGERVLDVDASSVRWPWTTCPAAAGPLRALAGMALSERCLAVGEHTDPKANCTHMFDLAGLAVAHAARGGERRQYDAEVPFGAVAKAGSVVRLWRDGELALEWTFEGRQLGAGTGTVRPIVDPPSFADAPWKGGFFQWADTTLPVEEAEAAIVLRRACEIGLGRGMDLDGVDRADELADLMRGVCYTMQPAVIGTSLRNKGTIRDFSSSPDALLD
ncbi:MAG TPA: DUF2889 domain-containing protein [Acidimicrobiia bacterium]|nr:DUF2889 domain-containing protein [Acidimicrobiia bacterium]